MKIKTKDEAQAFCNFIAFEKERHLADIKIIENKLILLKEIWKVTPSFDPNDIWVGYEDI